MFFKPVAGGEVLYYPEGTSADMQYCWAVLSPAYCFGHFAHGRKYQRLLPGYFEGESSIHLNKRYSKAFKTLETVEQRVAFVHLFLKSLTHQVLVLPITVGIEPKQIRVILTMGGEHTSLWQLTVTPAGHSDIHDGLMALGDNPQIAEQWPDLVKLADEVISGVASVLND